MTDILIVPHSAEHIRRRLTAHWSIYGATSCIYCMFGGTWIFLDYHVPKQHDTCKDGMLNCCLKFLSG